MAAGAGETEEAGGAGSAFVEHYRKACHIEIPPMSGIGGSHTSFVDDVFPVRMGYYPHARGQAVFRPRGSAEWVLIYCVDGRGLIALDKTPYNITSDMACFLPARMWHRYSADDAQPWSIYWLHMLGRRLGNYLSVLGVTPEAPLLTLARVGDITRRFEELFHYARLGHTGQARLALSSSLGLLLSELNLQIRSPDSKRRTSESRVRATIGFMEERLTQALTLETLARQARLSPGRYSHLFRTITGTAPVTFFLCLKMQKAAEYLATRDIRVHEAARLIGIRDPYYFSRQFKKVMGVSPRQYQRQMVEGDAV